MSMTKYNDGRLVVEVRCSNKECKSQKKIYRYRYDAFRDAFSNPILPDCFWIVPAISCTYCHSVCRIDIWGRD